MGLLRLLLWLVLLGALFWMIRRWWRGKTHDAPRQGTHAAAQCHGALCPLRRACAPGKTPADGEGQRWYCSAEHRRLQHERRD